MTPTDGRPSIDLNGTWRFIPDPERRYSADTLPDGEPIRVPGCWESQVPRPYGIVTAWYRRPLDVPAEWRGDRVVVLFGAVMYQCAVYLNGRRVGAHEGGYTPFEIELQDAIRWNGPNELALRVVNPVNAIAEYPAFSDEDLARAQERAPDLPLTEVPHGKQTWYSSTSGIWQSVRIERRPAVALARLLVRPGLPAEAATVRWALDGPLGGRGAADALEIRLIDPAGSEAASERYGLSGERSHGEIRLPVPSPAVWDVDRPNLYRVEATLLRGDGELDTLTARFGMRSIETRDGRIFLNGRPVYLLGALDQDFYPDGISTPPDRKYLDRQMRLAREMGINLLRCHIKVPDPAYLDAADEAGILVWSELPNWSRFTPAAAARGRETLRQMVETLRNHPSIVIWTIINEDWGTELRDEARDRLWLLDTYRWLKGFDPGRLVVDNSACDTPTTPNFHLSTDLADFHIYYLPPDNAVRWKNRIDEFARRPSWLFSPHGDAKPRGDEPLVLSEFGSWGLPRIDRLIDHYGGEPWWFVTGHQHYRPTGIQQRFGEYGLDRIWGSVDELAEATQWHQFEGLQYEIGQLRRHDSIQGYVITELTDAYWEANGLLDVMRGTKVYHDRLRGLNAPDVVVPVIARRDVFAGDRLDVDVHLSSYAGAGDGGRIAWELRVPGSTPLSGEVAVADWPTGGARLVGSIGIDIPHAKATSDGALVFRALDRDGTERARDEVRLAILSAASRQTANPLDLAIHDPLDIWGVAHRIEDLGHRIVDGDSRFLIATELAEGVRDHVAAGGRALILARAGAAMPDGLELARPVAVQQRQRPHAGWVGQRSPWDGDWISSWSWILHDEATELPRRNPLDFAYQEVLPDHVLLGYEPRRHREEVRAGMFVGWVHAPAALIWTFPQGRGVVTVTTFRVAPESGPVATVLLEELIQRTAGSNPAPAGRVGAAASARGR